MKHLLENWAEVETRMGGKNIMLCMDYDGTLTPIMPTPEEAVLPRQNKEILESLAKNAHCTLAVVSGRALSDVREKVNIKNILYMGNHGFEVDGPQLHFESLSPPQEKVTFDHLKEELAKNLSVVDGVWIEDKGLTLSVHYRLAKETDEPSIRKIFQKVCQPYLVEKKIRVTEGKKVLEVRPPIEWDKGKALLWLLAKERTVRGHQEIFPVFIGDDVTDKDALSAIAGVGIGIIVGEGGSSPAEYYLNNTVEVTAFLKRLLFFIGEKNTLKR